MPVPAARAIPLEFADVSSFIVEVVEGPAAGRQVPLDGPLQIGREPGAGLDIDDPHTSRHHVRLTPAANGVFVEDLDSSNGTFVNGNQVMAPFVASPGDKIQIGVSVLEIRTKAAVAERPSAVHAVPPALATSPRTPDYLAPVGERHVDTGLSDLLDVRVKRRAKTAPLAVLALAVLAVLVYLILTRAG